jgi:MFS transporter, DHA1 family, inner membrane transport protein
MTSTLLDSARRPAPTVRRTNLALFALAIGAFAIGTTEFATMGLLPQIAAGIDIDIPTAGRLISAYALGMVVGAPLIVALGAWLGGIVLAAGLSYAWPSRVAVVLPLLGLAVLAVGRWVERRSARSS